MKRKICVITGTRAEYGLLRWVMEGVRESADLELQVIATGSHLSPEYGLTYREIEGDGIRIDRKVEILLNGDTSTAVAKSAGLAVMGIAEALNELSPDLVVLLGDRYEILASAFAALLARIPIAHIHGGEITEGAFDDAIRHSITKMSHLHFVATEEYRRRVLQLGESPDRVFTVGGLGVESFRRLKLLDRQELEAALNFRLRPKNLLITFHPATLEATAPATQMEALLRALRDLDDVGFIFTMPNADPGSRDLKRLIDGFVADREHAISFTSLGQLRYFSCLQAVDGVIGNSSSGLLEVPSFQKGTVNIGSRQKGRPRATSVIDCDPGYESIREALGRLFSEKFQASLHGTVNPYGDGRASEKIVNTIGKVSLDDILMKRFVDVGGAFPGQEKES